MRLLCIKHRCCILNGSTDAAGDNMAEPVLETYYWPTPPERIDEWFPRCLSKIDCCLEKGAQTALLCCLNVFFTLTIVNKGKRLAMQHAAML